MEDKMAAGAFERAKNCGETTSLTFIFDGSA